MFIPISDRISRSRSDRIAGLLPNIRREKARRFALGRFGFRGSLAEFTLRSLKLGIFTRKNDDLNMV